MLVRSGAGGRKTSCVCKLLERIKLFHGIANNMQHQEMRMQNLYTLSTTVVKSVQLSQPPSTIPSIFHCITVPHSLLGLFAIWKYPNPLYRMPAECSTNAKFNSIQSSLLKAQIFIRAE